VEEEAEEEQEKGESMMGGRVKSTMFPVVKGTYVQGEGKEEEEEEEGGDEAVVADIKTLSGLGGGKKVENVKKEDL